MNAIADRHALNVRREAQLLADRLSESFDHLIGNYPEDAKTCVLLNLDITEALINDRIGVLARILDEQVR
jgi:hypothetical protein